VRHRAAPPKSIAGRQAVEITRLLVGAVSHRHLERGFACRPDVVRRQADQEQRCAGAGCQDHSFSSVFKLPQAPTGIFMTPWRDAHTSAIALADHSNVSTSTPANKMNSAANRRRVNVIGVE
jgi:hypothetical protein